MKYSRSSARRASHSGNKSRHSPMALPVQRLWAGLLGLLISLSALSGTSTVSVGDGTATVTNNTPQTLNLNVTSAGSDTSYDRFVQYSTSDGTATAGTDYTATSGLLQIPAGSPNADIPLTIAGSALTGAQASKAFSLNLDSAVGTGPAPSFLSAITLPTNFQNPFSTCTPDLNGDGRPDLVSFQLNGTGISVRLNESEPGAALSFGAQVLLTAESDLLARPCQVADLDGDGREDVVFSRSPSRVAGLLNRVSPGVGSLSADDFSQVTLGAGGSVFALTDLNGDGRPDLISASPNQNPGSAHLQLNLTPAGGPVAFSTEVPLAAEQSGAFAIAAADLNGDGRPDLVIGEFFSQSVAVLLNQIAPGANSLNDGSFSAQQRFDLGADPADIVLEDVNGDGRRDVLVLDNSSVKVLINQLTVGATSVGVVDFAAAVAFSTGLTGSSPTLQFRDLNGDGKPEPIVTTNTEVVRVLPNRTVPGSALSAGSFGATLGYFTQAPAPVTTATTADFNLDGKPDLLATTRGTHNLSVLRNITPMGVVTLGFDASPLISGLVFAGEPVAADFNGDGKVDLASVSGGSDSLRIRVALNTTAPGAAQTSYAAPVSMTLIAQNANTSALSVGDFNLDGRPDLVAEQVGGRILHVRANTGVVGALDSTGVQFQAGSGIFNLNSSSKAAVADFNLDGKPDLIGPTDSAIQLLRNTNIGGTAPSFAFAETIPTGMIGIHRQAIADFNGDGKPDIGALNESIAPFTLSVGTNTTEPGSEDFAFSFTDVQEVDFDTADLVAGDFDGDGRPDLLAIRTSNDSLLFFRNTAAAGAAISFAPGVEVSYAPTTTDYNRVQVADIDGDSRPDFLLLSSGTPVSVLPLLNRSTPGSLSVVAEDPILVPGNSNATGIVSADLDLDGRADFAVAMGSDGTLNPYLNNQFRVAGTPDVGTATIAYDLPAAVSADPAELDLGTVSTGDSAIQTVAITNPGSAAVALADFAVTGAGFTLYGTNCPASLAAGAQCQVAVEFRPAGVGMATGALDYTAGGAAQSVALSASEEAAADPRTTADNASRADDRDSGAVSADGRFMVFQSTATDLVAGQNDTIGTADVFLYDTTTRTVRLISHTGDGRSTGTTGASLPTISADGRYVVFRSSSTNLRPGLISVGPGTLQIYLYDTQDSSLRLVSHTGDGLTGASDTSNSGVISADGSKVVFHSRATDIGVTGGLESTPRTGGFSQFNTFVFDTASGQLRLVNHTGTAEQNVTPTNGVFVVGAGAGRRGLSISADGSRIAFVSQGTANLGIAGLDYACSNCNTRRNVFTYDTASGALQLVSHSDAGFTTAGNGNAELPKLSASGNRIVFESVATNAIAGVIDANGPEPDIFAYSTADSSLQLISRSAASATTTGNAGSIESDISADGQRIVFRSIATDLVDGQIDAPDAIGASSFDIFLHDRGTASTVLLSRVAGTSATAAGNFSVNPAISGDGSVVAFKSFAGNLVAGFVDGDETSPDLYAYRVADASLRLVSHVPGQPAVGGNGDGATLAERPVIAANGSRILNEALASNLETGVIDTNGQTDVLDYEVATGVNRYISLHVDTPLVELEVLPAALMFPGTTVGQSSAPQTVILTNSGSVTITLDNPSISGTAFAVMSGGCAPPLLPGASCDISVTFQPTAVGDATGAFNFTSNAPTSPHSISFSGTGLGAVASVAPVAFIDFGELAVGQTSAAQMFSLTNTGNQPALLGSVALAPILGMEMVPVGDYVVENDTCSNETLAANGGNCTVMVRFAPITRSPHLASLVFPGNWAGSQPFILLSGTGAALDLGTVNTGSSATQTHTITNPGNTAVSLGGFAVSTGFGISANTCEASLAEDAECMVTVSYTPTQGGRDTGLLTYTRDGNAQSVALSGTASGRIPVACDADPDQRPIDLIRAVERANTDTVNPQTIQLATACLYSFTQTNQIENADGSRFVREGANALPVINGNLSIEGNGAIIERASSATGQFRLIATQTGSTLALNRLTLRGGRAGPVASQQPGRSGGAIHASGVLTVSNSTLSDNRAGEGSTGGTSGSGPAPKGGDGGAIYASDAVTISSSTLSNNVAGTGGFSLQTPGGDGGGGGAIFVQSAGTVTISNSTLIDNVAGGGGLGHLGSGDGGDGGAIFVQSASTVTIGNSTLSANAVGLSGGPSPGNSGVGSAIRFSGSGATLSNNILSGASDVCTSAPLVLGSHNLITDTSCGSSSMLEAGSPTTTTALKLGPLTDNGGPTKTIALLPGSVAIDAGNSALCSAAPVNNLDQRGISRDQGSACDIGAFEFVNGVSANPASLNFGSQVVGIAATAQTITITDASQQNVQISYSGTAAADYSGASCVATGGDTCMISVDFTPSDVGSRPATLRYESDGGSVDVDLSGTGVARNPQLSFVAGDSVSFGTQPVNSTSGVQSLSIRNSGNVALNLSVPVASGADPTAFALDASGSCDATLAVNETCTRAWTFTPTAVRAFSATNTLIASDSGGSNAAVTPLSVSLSGTGTGALATLTPATQDFGIVPVGNSSNDVLYSLSNTGNASLTIASLSSTSSEFEISNSNCGAMLSAMADCTFLVRFAPAATGVRNGQIRVLSNAAADVTPAELSGTGEATCSATATPLAFGNYDATNGTLMTSTVSVTCTAGTSYSIGLDAGDASGATVTTRNLTGTPSGLLDYALFRDAVRTQNWGNTAATDTVDGTGTGAEQIFTVYGRVPAGQAKPAGSYLDSITTTVTYGARSATADFAVSATVPTGMLTLNAVSPVMLADERVGTAGTAQIVEVTNTGDAIVIIASVDTSGDTADFTVGGCASVVLDPGEHCDLSVAASPQTDGAKSVTITVDSDANDPELVVSFNAIEPGLTVTGNGAFADVLVNPSPVPTRIVTLTNSGSGPVTVNSATLDAPMGDFSISQNNCNGANGMMTDPGDDCTIDVSFNPQATGAQSTTLRMQTTAGERTLSLSGTGVAPGIELDPASLAFGSVIVDEDSAVQTVTLRNTGSAPLVVGQIPASVGRYFVDDLTDTCSGEEIAFDSGSGGNTCTFGVRFSPTANGLQNQSLEVPSSAGPRTLSLSGTGVARSLTVSLDAATLAFGGIAAGTTDTRTLMLSNTGNVPGMIAAPQFGGDDVAQFSVIGGSCITGASLAAGTSCSLTVQFAPTAGVPMDYAASLALGLADGATTATANVGLSGTGLQALAVFDPAVLDFGEAQIDTGDTRSVTLRNTGNIAFNFSLGIQPAGDFGPVIPSCALNLAPGGSCTIGVGYRGSDSLGPQTAALVVTNTDTSTTLATLPLQAEVVDRDYTLSPTGLAFGNVPVNSSADITLTLTQASTPATAGVTITELGLFDSDTPFSLISETCTAVPAPLQDNGNQCTIVVRFSPTAGGAASTRLGILSNVDGNVLSARFIDLSGFGSLTAATISDPPPVTAAEPGQSYTSDPITVAGINVPTAISVTGGEYSINGGGFAAAAGTVQPNDLVRIRRNASPNFATQVSATLSVGAVDATYRITTRAADVAPAGFSFTPVNDVARNTPVVSNGITIGGIEVAVPIAVVGGAYSVNGGAFTGAAGTVVAGDSVRLSVISSPDFATPVTATLTLGEGGDAQSADFVVTTLDAVTMPNPFGFGSRSDVALNSLQTSNAVTIDGTNSDAPIRVSGGEYSIGTGLWTSADGLIAPGAQVRVRVTASALFSTDATVTLDVGGVEGSFVVTTLAADTTPDAFAFGSVDDVVRNSVQTSGAQAITGINTGAPVSVTGGEYSLDDGPWTSADGTIEAGQSVRVRGIAANAFSTTVTVVLDIGSVTGSFAITTLAAITDPDDFGFGTVTGVPLNSVQTSAPQTITGINTGSPISIVGGAYRINGGAFTTVAGLVNPGDMVDVQLIASADFRTAVTATVTIGSRSGSYTVTTLAEDLVPDAFSFTSISGVNPDSEQTSDAVTITGLNSAAPISVSDGRYSIDGGAFTSAAGTITSGQQVRVRRNASSDFAMTVQAQLDIGGVSAPFTITTRDPVRRADDFVFEPQVDVARDTDIVSNAVTISGIEAGVPISVSNGEYSLDGGAFTSAAGTVLPGQSVLLRLRSSAAFETSETATLTVGENADAVSADFTVTTASADVSPDAFSFISPTGVEPGSMQISNSVTVRGIDAPIAIRIDGGEYRINNGAFTATAGQVRVGDTVQVRTQAPSTFGTMLTVTLSVGDRKVVFRVSTPTELPPITVTADSGGGSAGWSLLLLLGLASLLQSRRRAGLLTAAATLLSIPLQAAAFDTAKLYVGLRMGHAQTDSGSADVTRRLQARSYDVNAQSDGDVLGGELYGGYRLLPWLAAEAGYLAAESRDVQLSGMAPPTLEPLLDDAIDEVQGMGNVLRMGMSAERAIRGRWHLAGRAAGYRWDSSVSAVVEDTRVKRSRSGLGWTAGLGLRYPVVAQLSMGLSADYWSSSDATDFSFVSLQLQWDFAGGD